MKRKCLILVPLLFLAQSVLAADTDIYGVSSIDVKPNVLIVFDNSGSMGTKDVPGEIYDPGNTYPGTYTTNAVYKSGRLYFPDIDDDKWQCEAAKIDLKNKGYWRGKLRKSRSTGVVTCGGRSRKNYRLGNFENFDDGDTGDTQSRMVVAKEVIAKLIYDNHETVRFGLMKFNTHNTNQESGYIVAECADDNKDELIGSYDPTSTIFTDSDQSASYGAIGGMRSETWTPLAETIGEAGLYFAGKNSWFNDTTSGSGYPLGRYNVECVSLNKGCQDYSTSTPIQYRCQKSYIILMTDGEPTQDNNKFATNNYIYNLRLTEAVGDGNTNYLDDVTNFLSHNDIRVIGSNPSADDKLRMGEPGDFENQTVVTYTIGFKQELALLQSAATNGGGEYYTADNASTLNEALNSIISSINESNEAFSAAAVPVSRANKAYAGNYVYYGLFQPMNAGNWVGNLKKYGITDTGVIQDADGLDAVSGGVLIDNARSYWNDTIDGPSVGKGGAGEKLYDDIENGMDRRIYTYTGTNTNLTDSSNAFNTTNTALDSYANLTDNVIGAVRHEDSSWPLGSFLHSQPLVVHYDDNDDGEEDHSIIFAGSNDGMLHCFDDNDGAEKWGFIPGNLLDKLNDSATGLEYFVDGSPVLYGYDHDGDSATQDKKMLIVGQRRGGYSFTALDISDYDIPVLKYEIAQNFLGAGNELLGQSWGKPQLSKMMNNATSTLQDVFLMVGGYDDNQDNDTPSAMDSKGRALYAIDTQTGALFPSFNFNYDNFNSMTHSIVAASAFENPKSRTVTRVYAGDMNGNLFAFRDDVFHRNQDVTKLAEFGGGLDGVEDGIWGQKLKIFSSPGKKIFYAPNIANEYFDVSFTYLANELYSAEELTNEGLLPFDEIEKIEKRVGDYVFYGTGDRAHPERTDVKNTFYAIKNSWQWKDTTVDPPVDTATPAIVEAYIDKDDKGKVKAIDDDRVLVGEQRDENGDLIDAVTSNELFIIDVTDDLLQNTETEDDKKVLYTNYVTDAINHENNKGWFLNFVEADGSQVGEKMVSSPIIFGGVIYFTTYIPEDTTVAVDNTDPCANPGAKGNGYLYALGYKFGEAVLPLDDPTGTTDPGRKDRRKKLKVPGIPPEPVLVIHEGKPTIITGFETQDPLFQQGLERFYWRQLNR